MTPPDPAPAPQRPAGRYGETRGARRALQLGAIGLVGVALLVYLMWVALHHANPEVRAGLLSYEVRDDSTVEVVLQVVRSEGTAAVCEVRAQNVDDVTVGTARAEVAADAPPRSRVTVEIRTTERAVNGELVRCTAVD